MRCAGVVAILLEVGAVPIAAQVIYENPVLGGPHAVADPFLLKWNGEYYLYATGDPIVAYHSTDLVEWREIGPVLRSSPAPAWNQKDVWAPEVVYRNGTFYLSYTATRGSPDWRVEEAERRIGVATSNSPRGPFVDMGHPVTPGWGIDSHVFRDPDTGRDYLFYSYLYEPRLPGAGIVVDSMPTPVTVGGAPAHVTRGSEAWEDKDGDPNDGSLRYTNEAPTVIKRNGRYYMMYSGGSWDLPTYAMGYAVSDRLMQGDLDGPGWTKLVPPILRSTDLVHAPGHNSVAKAPNNVDDITAYHARVAPFNGPGDRFTFLDRLYWNHDRLYMQPPSLGALPAPDRPLFGDIFDRASGPLGDRWSVLSGTWRVADGQALQTRGGVAIALPDRTPLDHYVFEANVRLERGSRGAAGVAAYYVDRANHLDVWLDAAQRALVTTGVLRGRAIPDERTSLAADFGFDAYHQILVTKNGGRIRISLDGVQLQERTLELGAGRPGIQTREAQAHFDGIAWTAHFEDAFAEPAVTWSVQDGTWMVDEGALQQSAGVSGRAVAFKGDPAVDYEFTASVRWRDEETVRSKVGIIAAASSDGRMVLGGFDRTIWPYARFWVQHIEAGDVRHSIRVGLPRGFLYDVYHTIRVVKQGDGFTFYLDGREIAAARFPIALARPGLFTEGARAAFDDVAMKHLVVPHNLLLDGSFEAEPWDDGTTAPGAPWQLTAGAFRNMCCAHSGTYRLLLPNANARASQTTSRLPAGRYTLLAWITTRDAEAEVQVAVTGSAASRARASGGDWRRVRVDFDVPAGGANVSISFAGQFAGNAGAFVAVDDVYLFAR
jgi:GH43 family beta-xylosidase